MPRPHQGPGGHDHARQRHGGVPAADHVPPSKPARADAAADAAGAAASVRAEAADRGDAPRHRVIVDGSNVAHAGEQGPRLANLLAVRDHLIEDGFEPIIVADAALRHQIDDRERYEALIEDGTVQQAPAGTDADYFILSFANELDAAIVSNDRFRDGGKLADEARKRQIRFMVVAGEVVLEKRTRRR